MPNLSNNCRMNNSRTNPLCTREKTLLRTDLGFFALIRLPIKLKESKILWNIRVRKETRLHKRGREISIT